MMPLQEWGGFTGAALQLLPKTSDSHNIKPETPANDDARGTDV